MNMIRKQMPFQNLTFFLLRQGMENLPSMASNLLKQSPPPPLGDKHHMVFAIPFGMR
jgi:hypothetical protein